MKTVAGTAPFLRRPRETKHIMRELLIGLGVIFLAAVIYNFTLGVNYGLKTILIMAISILFTLISDVIAGSLRFNEQKDGDYADYLLWFVKENFSIVTAVIFALTVPVGTPVYVVALGSIFATLIVKHTFGGFGNNIFNPAALGRIFLALAFGGQLKAYLPGGENLAGSGLVAGATVTGQFAGAGTKFLTGTAGGLNVSLFDLWLGNHSGALGETFTLLIIVVGVVLAAREVINWRTPVFLFGTVLVSSVFISLIAGANVGEYILLQFGLGGLVFGAIFMFTDPVTSPTSNYGKALIGVLGGFFNILIRVAGNLPEGTAFSIALINALSPAIDRLISGRTDVKMWKPYTVTGVTIFLSVSILSWVSAGQKPVSVFANQMGALNTKVKPSAAHETVVHEYLIEKGISARYDVLKGKKSLGIVYEGTVDGFNPGINFMVGFNDGKYAGFSLISDDETPDLGGEYLLTINDQIKGKAITADILTNTGLSTGVTVTNNALKDILELCADDFGGTLVVPDPNPVPTSLLNLNHAFSTDTLTSYALAPKSKALNDAKTNLKYVMSVGDEVYGTVYEAKIKAYADGLHFLAAFKDGKHEGFYVIEENESTGWGDDLLEEVDDYLRGREAGDYNFDDLGNLALGITKTRSALETMLDIWAADHLADLESYASLELLASALNTPLSDAFTLKTVTTELYTAGTLHKYEVFNGLENQGIVYEAKVYGFSATPIHLMASFKDGKHAGFYVINDEESADWGKPLLTEVNDYLVGKDAGVYDFDDLGNLALGITKTRSALETILALFVTDYLNPDIVPFEEFTGTYETLSSAHPTGFTTNVTVGVDAYYHIIALEYDVIADSSTRISAEEEKAVTNYYTSITVAEFKTLPVPSLTDGTTGSTVANQDGEHLFPGNIYSSRALYEAINDAFKDISVYQGSETSIPRTNVSEEITLLVDVYVDTVTGVIKTLDILGGDSTTQWAEQWANMKEDVINYYRGVEVLTFLAYADDQVFYGEGYADFVTLGLTYSPRRLFAAVQNALEGYGA